VCSSAAGLMPCAAMNELTRGPGFTLMNGAATHLQTVKVQQCNQSLVAAMVKQF
jgi:hypothetical protein